MQSYKTVDECIATYPSDVQKILQALRKTIQKAAPNATEKIAYGIPTFVYHGNLVHFAAYKNHIGFYPASSGVMEFKKELAPYETSKGTIKFPIDKPLPLGLITKIVRFRVKENKQSKEPKKQS